MRCLVHLRPRCAAGRAAGRHPHGSGAGMGAGAAAHIHQHSKETLKVLIVRPV